MNVDSACGTSPTEWFCQSCGRSVRYDDTAGTWPLCACGGSWIANQPPAQLLMPRAAEKARPA